MRPAGPGTDDDELVELRHSRPSLRGERSVQHERSREHEDSAEDQIGGPDLAGEDHQHRNSAIASISTAVEHEEGDEQPEDDGLGGLLRRDDGLVADDGDDLLERVDRVGCPVGHGALPSVAVPSTW